MEKSKQEKQTQTPAEMLQEQEEILHEMEVLAQDGNLGALVDVQDQAELVDKMKEIHDRIQVRLGREAASDLAPTVSPAEAA